MHAWLRAFTARDLTVLPTLFHPDVDFEAILTPAGTRYRGLEGIRSLIEAVHGRYPAISAEFVSAEEVGTGLVVAARFLAEEQVDPETAYVHFEFDGDAIRRARAFRSADAARAAAELAIHDEFRTLFDSALEAILLVDAQGVVRELNASACTLVGDDRDAIIGRRFAQFVTRGAQRGWERSWRELNRTGQMTSDGVAIARHGENVPVDVRARAYYRRGLHLVLVGVRIEGPASQEPSARVLTPREREIFRMLALGFSAPEIADRLFLSPATVRTHVQNGVARLGAKTRVQAVAIALTQGEISL